MMLPPKSGRKAVRLRNATTIISLSRLYSRLLSAWINDQLPGPDETEKAGIPSATTEIITEIREQLVAVWIQLQATKTQTAIAKWEGGVRGAWPMNEYMNLVDTQIEMISHLASVRRLSGNDDREMTHPSGL